MIITEEKRTQIVSYIVHAGEILQKDNHFPKNKYKYVYLPTGPELYTGVLKAAGYLFLNKNLNNIVFLVEQTEYPNKIISYIDDKEILIRGRKIKNNGIEIGIDQYPITLELFEQLLYIRLLTQVTSITILGIGSKINKKEIIDILDEIKKLDFGVVCLGTASKEEKSVLSKREDKKMMEHMINKKLYKEQPSRLGNVYTSIIKKYKVKPELVAYVHSSDLGIKSIKQIGYICMVA